MSRDKDLNCNLGRGDSLKLDIIIIVAETSLILLKSAIFVCFFILEVACLY